jgi:hypothetical protein
MANAFINTTLITKMMVLALKNRLVLSGKVDRQVDNANLFNGDIGNTAYVNRPIHFTASDGAAITAGQITDIEEATVPVVLNYYKKVVFSLSSLQKTLNLPPKDINERLFKPAAEQIAQEVESAIAAQYIYLPNLIGTPGTIPATLAAVAAQGTRLSNLGVPDGGMRNAFYSPTTKAKLADGLKGVFPETISKRAIEEAGFGRYGGLNSFECQSLPTHTVGVATGTPLVNGADQNVTYAASKNSQSQVLLTDGWTASKTGILKAGDVITLADVYAVNDRTKVSTGELQNFAVIADADSDAVGNNEASLTISPAIITSGPYQNVTAAPANNAVITVLTGTGGTSYKQNMFFHPNAITLCFARLAQPEKGTGILTEQITEDGISMTCFKGSDITLSKSTIYSFDVHFGVKVQNPLFGGRLTE